MSGREKGKKLLADLASKVRKEVTPDGEPVLHARGQKAVGDLAKDLAGPDGLPGLQLFRDTTDKFRVQRPARNGEIAVAWQRPIGAIVVVVHRGERREAEVKYVYREADDEWHRMEGEGELYEDVSKWLVDVLYPEAKRTP
jgi:hypothetical protein